MNRWFPFVLFLYLPFFSIAQENFSGVIYDVGTREPLDQVRIESSNPNQFTYSNESGFFNLNLNTVNDGFPEAISLFDNTLYWSLDEPVTFRLGSLNGATLNTNVGPPSGAWKLPAQPAAYYFMLIETNELQSRVLLFSDGEDYSLVQKENPFNTPSMIDSILTFTRSDYFERSSPIDDPTIFERYNLLRTSYDSLDYFNEMLRHEGFEMLHNSPPNVHFSDIQSVKVLYDFVEDQIYYVNLKKYLSHYSFANKFLDYTGTSTSFFYTQYGTHPTRFLYLVTINYHVNLDKYVFQFSSTDLVDCEGVRETYEKLLATSFFGDKLYFSATNSRWDGCTDVPIITSEELYLGQNYQALNLEENYGYLRKIDIDTLSSTYIGRHDVVLINSVPNDISVVSGIITTEFQTALSHINVLSHNRNTPNMALRDGWINPKLDTLLGKLVYLSVEADSFIVRTASIEEAETFWNANEPQTPVILDIDTTTSGLFDLSTGDISSVSIIGGKAANFSELQHLAGIPLPENYFAIPFYYYQQHITEHGIHNFIDQMLADNQFATDVVYRQQQLNELKDLIIDAPLSQELIDLVENEINHFNEFDAFRFRSSTNAEDLEGFSGAGLYDSFSAKKNHATKTIDNAIKKVWASLWNLRAFDERDYFMIDQHSIAMGILVHRSFPDEDANGVVLTKNLYDTSNHGYTVNVQYKEFSIVNPDPGVLHDELLIHTLDLTGNGYTLEYLTHSNIPELNGETVLTDGELYELAEYCTIIKQHYFHNISSQTNPYLSFAVDIEFKVDSEVEDRKLYIKQARILNDD